MAAKKIDILKLNFNAEILSNSEAVELKEFSDHLIATAKILETLTAKHQPQKKAVEHWDALIRAWADDSTLPLYIRKSEARAGRGSVVIHGESKREIIITDNGPAHFTLSMALNNNLISLAQIRTLIESDAIPVAFALSGEEKDSKYRFSRHEVDQPNKKGWKVAHIDEIGLKTRKSVSQIPLEVLKAHFIKFLSPANMFLYQFHMMRRHI